MHPRLKVLEQVGPGARAVANGWVESSRRMKRVAFADLTDGSSPRPLPVVLDPAKHPTLNTGACVEIEGTLKESIGKQKVELEAEKVKVVGPAGGDYPLQKKYHSPEYLRQLPQLRWKTRQAQQILRYRSWALTQFANFFNSEDCVQVNSPILTASDCEGAGEAFKIAGSEEFFGKPVYLTVSSQLHLEVFAAALGRVWNATPAFRAEASDTNRHLSEFWMIEAELAFVNNLKELWGFCERQVKSAVPRGRQAEDLLASKRTSEACNKLESRWRILEKPWAAVEYREACNLLEQAFDKGLVSNRPTDGLNSEHEKFLAGTIMNAPTVVTDYPSDQKPFYMLPSGPNTVACFDVLLPEIGEIVGGSLREHDELKLRQHMSTLGMDIAAMNWYLDLRKYGSFPHGGYGLGFERLVMYACGIDNIRDASGFSRGFGMCPC